MFIFLGFTGHNCEETILMCEDSPCENDALCLMENNQINCYCVPDYHGDRCQYQYDECQLGPRCMNGGTCIDGIDNFTCSCPPDLTGVLCECLIEPNNTLDCTYIRNITEITIETTIFPSTEITTQPVPNQTDFTSTILMTSITELLTTELPTESTSFLTENTKYLTETSTELVYSTEFSYTDMTVPSSDSSSTDGFSIPSTVFTMPSELSTIASVTPLVTDMDESTLVEVTSEDVMIPSAATKGLTLSTHGFTLGTESTTIAGTGRPGTGGTIGSTTGSPRYFPSISTEPSTTDMYIPFNDTIYNVTGKTDCMKIPCKNGGTCIGTPEGSRVRFKFTKFSFTKSSNSLPYYYTPPLVNLKLEKNG